MSNQTKTRKTRTPKPIPAMLPEAFATAIENRIAEFNNTLAREGRLTDDPAYVMLRSIRRELVNLGVATFVRTASGASATPTAEAAPKAKTAKKRRTRRAAKAAPAAPSVPVHVIEGDDKEAQVAALQVAGSVSDNAPYGLDASGAALAPYGVKKNGVPMKRRGAPAKHKAEETTETADLMPAPTGVTAEPIEAAAEEASEEETEEETEETEDEEAAPEEEGAEEEEEDVLDDLLDSLV